MANPNGVNQLGSDRVPYGQAKQMKQLAAEAPMSGAPVATAALNTPQRARKQPVRRQRPVAQQAQPAQPPVLAAPPQMDLATRAQQIGDIPGASPLVRQLAQGAILETAAA